MFQFLLNSFGAFTGTFQQKAKQKNTKIFQRSKIISPDIVYYERNSQGSGSITKIDDQTYSNPVQLSRFNYSITNCLFKTCISHENGGAILFAEMKNSQLKIQKCNFFSCYAQLNGGGVYSMANTFGITQSCSDNCITMDGSGFTFFIHAKTICKIEESAFINSKSSTPDTISIESGKTDASKTNISHCQSINKGSAGFAIKSQAVTIATTSFYNLAGLSVISFQKSPQININLCNFDKCNASNSILFLTEAANLEVSYSYFVKSHSLTIIFQESQPPVFYECTFDSISTMIDSSAILDSCITGMASAKTHELDMNSLFKCYGESLITQTAPSNNKLYLAIGCSIIVLCIAILFIIYLRTKDTTEPLDKAEIWQQVNFQSSNGNVLDDTDLID